MEGEKILTFVNITQSKIGVPKMLQKLVEEKMVVGALSVYIFIRECHTGKNKNFCWKTMDKSW